MSMMKRVGIPILEALAEGPCTRMELFERVEDQLPDLQWPTFKRFMSLLRSDGMIRALPISKEHPHTRMSLTADGEEVAKEFCCND